MTYESMEYVCRDGDGRFAPPMNDEQLKRYSKMTIRLREIEERSRKEAHMLNHESQLLYIMVDFFETPYVEQIERYSEYDLRRYPRKKYHNVLLIHPASRKPPASACVIFSVLVKRLVEKGWVQHIRHGRKHYLKITEMGMDKIRKHHDYYSRGII